MCKKPANKSVEKIFHDLEEDTDQDKNPEHEKRIVCRECMNEITSPRQRILRDGAHEHTFANPHGLVFHIQCYKDAWGCGYAGPSVAEFTWFPGYTWRVAVCGRCTVHLGWLYEAGGGNRFHGLIADRLGEP